MVQFCDDSVETLILGAGLTGLAAASVLQEAGREAVILEAGHRPGGECVTDSIGEFLFDKTGHWLHLRFPRIRSFVEKKLAARGVGLLSVERKALIYTSGRSVNYPFQSNLHGLPPQVVNDCLLGFIKAFHGHGPDGAAPSSSSSFSSFEDFILSRLGEGIARHFMIPYNERLWGVHPRELSPEWCGRFVPTPSLEEVVAGAVGVVNRGQGYNAVFHYPDQGGIGTLSQVMAEQLAPGSVLYGCRAEAVDTRARVVRVQGGRAIRYKHLISTVPLPALASMVKGELSDEGQAACGQLRWTSVPYLNVGVESDQVNLGAHWIYFPEKEFPFYRVGSFSNPVPYMAPDGCGSLYVELADRRPFNRERDLPVVSGKLVQAGIVPSEESVLFAEPDQVRVAYVIFDHQYSRARSLIMGELEELGVQSAGRYGSWVYNSMEDALLAGMDSAAKLL